ncbi:MAG: hypothetical protein H0X37_25460 [Herpetosiphonaceae bacterium]|nr:hypothetical protein [Herpetosiphonaceae bacterium]
MLAERLPHVVTWDDQDAVDQQIDAGEMMRRLAGILGGEYREKQFRGEPRYEVRCYLPGGFELSLMAGHIYDDRETLSLAIELRAAALSRPLASYHLSGGIDRIKASADTAWLRATNGTVVILGHGLGGILEVQN